MLLSLPTNRRYSGLSQRRSTMIDYDRFWAEAGCLPGMTAEQTEKTLKRQLGDDGFEAFMAERAPRPAATGAQIKAWEKKRGVRLPDVLRQALSRHDGGYVRGSQFRILPLVEIGPIEDDTFWDFASYDEEHVPDRELAFRFAEDEETTGSFYLVFARGPEEEPGVFEYHDDGGDLARCSASITKFLARMLQSDETPMVDWSEAKRLPIVAEETIELTPLYGEPSSKVQILARQDETLVLFTHERSPVEERLTRTLLPLPLEERMAWVRPFRPEPLATYSLILQPEQHEGIVELESKRTEDGRWKNAKSNGVPVCVMFESSDKARLEALRREVLGERAAARAQAEDQRLEKMQQVMGGLASREQRAAGMHMFLQMMGQAGGPTSPGMPTAENLPLQAAALQAILQQRMQTLMENAKHVLGEHPLSPEIQRLLEENQRRLDDKEPD
jgi:hypothetical protein